MWNTRTWFSSACGACFCTWWLSVTSDSTCCTWRNKPPRCCSLWWPGNVWDGVVPHPESVAEFIKEHVGGAKVVAGTRLGSVGIHDYVGIVRSQNEELHEEPARPAVVASRLVQACNQLVLVHGSMYLQQEAKQS